MSASPKDGTAPAGDDLNGGEVPVPLRYLARSGDAEGAEDVPGPGEGPVRTCSCGAATAFDADAVGETCGGLTRIGWMICTACGRGWHAAELGRSYEKWRVSGSGRSVEIGTGRVRLEGHPDPASIAARIARLPELELEVLRLRAAVKAGAP